MSWADGSPMKDVEVLVTACDEPIAGLAGGARSDRHGEYSVWANVPAGIKVPDEGLMIYCRVVVGRGIASSEPVAVRFMKTKDATSPVVVDLRQPATGTPAPVD